MLSSLKVIFGTVMGYTAYILGGLDTIFYCFLVMLVVDYISGVLAAIYNKTLNSETG